MKYPSYCCQNCGENIGWIGKFLFIGIFHKCGKHALECRFKIQGEKMGKMSGECEKCGEHALECKCMITIQPEKNINLSESIKIYINKEYFRNEFKKVFEKWDHKLTNGMNMYDEEEFLNDLINLM
jgi:hypothetical protein